MPLPWLIGVAAVAAAAAIAKAVSDDSPSSSSSTTNYDDSERHQQEQEAKRQREREALKARVQSLAGDRREQLKAQLRGAALTLAASTDKHNPVSEGVTKMTRVTLDGVTGTSSNNTSAAPRRRRRVMARRSKPFSRRLRQSKAGTSFISCRV